MNDLKTNINLPLLYEVRKDALKKSREGIQGDTLFLIMKHMFDLLLTARKEGLLALEEAAQALPSDIKFYPDIKAAVTDVCDGIDAEDLMEILTSRYWSKNLQGEDALLFFFVILSIVRIQDNTPPHLLERLLTVCIPDEFIEKYSAYKKQWNEQRTNPTPLEHLLCSEPNIGDGGILVVKRLLEEKIQCATKTQLKKVLRAAKESDLEISLKGLAIPSKKKILSMVPEQKAVEYAQDCEFMGPVRQIDMMEAFAELIAVFEKQLF